ncbi:C-GCAxxG-C-C family protein [Pelotomaculum propionicicum]|uniref:C-GCAxxG-C-C family protein n=1 Tax=Pelotomaculum propionicicum TaxID=258475 RepID=UPI003B761C73
MSDNANQVVSLHKEGGLNCAQAMLSVYGAGFGLDKETAIKLASCFGAGMGRMGETCGAVTGAFMVLGLTYEPEDPKARGKVYDLVRKFRDKFVARNGSIRCKDLLGYDMDTEQGMRVIKEKKLTAAICPKMDRDAAEILEEILSEI